MAFAQLTFRESLRDIDTCLRAQAYHMGIRGQVQRSALAESTATRDWRIYAEFAQRLTVLARKLYATQQLGMDLSDLAYALDATTIDWALSLFPWAPFRTNEVAVQVHTQLNLLGNMPSLIQTSDGKPHNVNILNQQVQRAGTYYVPDCGQIELARLYRLHQAGSFFVARARKNMIAKRRNYHLVDRSSGVSLDQTLMQQGYQSARDHPHSSRGVRFKDPETSARMPFTTNNTALPALQICALYMARWQVEIFLR